MQQTGMTRPTDSLSRLLVASIASLSRWLLRYDDDQMLASLSRLPDWLAFDMTNDQIASIRRCDYDTSMLWTRSLVASLRLSLASLQIVWTRSLVATTILRTIRRSRSRFTTIRRCFDTTMIRPDYDYTYDRSTLATRSTDFHAGDNQIPGDLHESNARRTIHERRLLAYAILDD